MGFEIAWDKGIKSLVANIESILIYKWVGVFTLPYW